MYVVSPGAGVLAINATNGDLIWDYWRETPKEMADVIGGPMRARTKGLAIFEDLVFYDAPDGFLVALDAKTRQAFAGRPSCTTTRTRLSPRRRRSSPTAR